MRVTNLKNTSGGNIDIALKEGGTISLPAGCEMNDVDISNLEDLKGKITFKENLTEIKSSQGKTKLYD